IQQIGRGVKVSTVQQMFTQGSFINSAQDTDMAITGEGFFQVRDRVTGELMYTRAGNFTIDKNGLIETPAGYVLQGWEMSIAKPGEEAKRMGAPVDVKVITMNAPPVETSQIKVVCNLNSDDTSAYIYPQEGWAELYADQIARPPAEVARRVASDGVYSAAVHGSAYPSTSPYFNQAYENYMTQVLGYIPGVGAFLRQASATLSMASAEANAAASAYSAAHAAGPGPQPSFSAGIATSSNTFNNAFQTAYIARMSASGYSYSAAVGFFYEPASAAIMSSATASALNSASAAGHSGYPPVPPFAAASAASASKYMSAYLNYMSGLSYHYNSVLQVFYHSASPTAGTSALAAANSAGQSAYSAIAAPASFPSNKNDTAFDTTYYNNYIAKMNAQGYSYQGLTFTKTPSASEVAAANAVVQAAVNAGTPTVPAGYPAATPANPSTTYNTAYNTAYASYMANSGFYYSAAASAFKATATSVTLNSANTFAYTSAGISAASATGYPSTFSDPTSAAAYNTAYRDYMSARGFHYLSAAGQFIKSPTDPSVTTLTQAKATAHTAGVTAYSNLPTAYRASTGDAYFDNLVNSNYYSYMTNTLGYTAVTSTFFQKTPSAAEQELARQTALSTAKALAANAGEEAFKIAYKPLYELELTNIRNRYAPWQLEGNGFAGAWDGSDLSSPIDPENYTHANPWTIYDSLGNAHVLMVYYQPNPHMENVWDYIITCDPTEDARKDVNNRLFMEGSTFDGLIQKGKITFTADGPDRHGGVVKDIEAQNIDLTKTAAARLISGAAAVQNKATANSMDYYHLDGYYKGTPVFCAVTGSMVASKRTYEIKWRSSLNTVPDVSGFVWSDSDGNSGTIPVYEKNYTGPYVFGSGLSVNFTSGGTPMRFTSGDSLTFVAESESIGWTNLTPNELGYFDFDVAFVQSASMALHPPYPQGMPTMIQHISLDMGARNPSGLAASWILDEQGTTQYATESINIFSSQDGYPPGSLQRLSIDKDGVMTGIYTNGRHQPLYQIGLTRFINPWGLAKLGDNVYMETRWSGTGTVNPPGYGGTGTIRANFLEQSNTDLADEIVNMIVTQRGFQANSKVVTTTDTMLAEVIEMKR
ncbi:MAG: flagellar hook-basal body complex protein, partial [Deltaproteobacteria bacterium]|nr:flagellar hook-basal body complex protein [Deltaproteobacteria bacterium]